MWSSISISESSGSESTTIMSSGFTANGIFLVLGVPFGAGLCLDPVSSFSFLFAVGVLKKSNRVPDCGVESFRFFAMPLNCIAD